MALANIDDLEDAPGRAAGVPLAESDLFAGYQDYFGFDETHRYVFPDGKQYIEFKPMTEGDRAKYEARTSRDVKFNRRTDDAAIRVDPAADRHALLASSVIGWHMARRNPSTQRWEAVPFSIGRAGCSFEQWLEKADPKVVNDLVDAIRKVNPWMTDEMTVEMVDEEISRLQDLRSTLVERDVAGKSS